MDLIAKQQSKVDVFSGNYTRLFERIRVQQNYKQLKEALSQTSQKRILVDNIRGSQDAFLLAVLKADLGRPQIYIAEDKEQAAYYQNTIDSIVVEGGTLFFPDSFKQPRHFEVLNTNNVLRRTEAMNRLSNEVASTEILVTYPEALFEKVVAPIHLEKQKISIKKGEDLDVDTMIGLLVEYAFDRVDFVYEPGQFSIRGGIVDIFSYGNEWPYRIDLFDEEVESIRTFNPSTQLSIRNIDTINIIPDVNSQFDESHKISVLEAFPEEAIIWIKDLSILLDNINNCLVKAEEYTKTLKPSEQPDLLKEQSFISPADIVDKLEKYSIAFLKKDEHFKQFDTVIKFDAKPQPTFNKNFKLLIEDLDKNKGKGIETFLFTDNERQIERFYSIFEDLQADVEIHPIKQSIHAGFIDYTWKVACYTDHQIFERFHRYRLRTGFTREQAINLKMLRELQPGDYVTHIDHGIGKYSGLEKININGHTQESVRLIYLNNDILYVSINSLHKISKYVGKEGTPPRVSKIGGDTWKKLKNKTKKKVKDIAKELIKLYAKRKASKGFAFSPDGYLQNELEASFFFEDTPDQYESTLAVKEDMMKDYPMDRLICGDVGFGKTEVAIRAAFKAVVDGKQVAILVPTTILALQHYKTFHARLENFGVTVDYVNRFRTTKEKTQIGKDLEAGKIDILIGTHAILNKKLKFKDLGLLVIDEEQKFGVSTKEKLRQFKVNVDTLTLTATPIPRTLQFSLMAARDLSLIKTPPPNRQAIHTERRIFSDTLIKESIYYETNRGGQVFFVHNRVKSLPDIAAMVTKMCPDLDIAKAHGQMDPKVLEKTLLDFIEGKYDVLICTNIIETGLDIPNANTIIINNAHHFGMSDLHQLRGRVGRSNKKAFCYLFAPPLSTLTREARKRLQTLEEFSDLGSGFHIAMKDLDIRGAGNLLGGEQSGFITDIGYETYQKILEEAVFELKEGEYKELFEKEMETKKQYVRDVEVETDIEMLIPDEYISNIQERLNIYTQIDKIETEEQIDQLAKALEDRFGGLPKQVTELFNGLRVRWACKKLGFEHVVLKNYKLRCYFVKNPQSPYFESALFKSMIAYVSTKGQDQGLTLKQSKTYLIMIKEGVGTLKDVYHLLNHVLEDLG